jgi:hypothetical protein
MTVLRKGTNMNRWNGLWVGAVLVLAGAAHAENKKAAAEMMLDGKKIQLARYAKALIGEGNVSVEIAPYKRDGKEGAILLFKGIEGPWDGKAFDHRINIPNKDGKDYITKWNDKDWVSVTQREGYDGLQYRLYVPEVDNEIKLSPSDGAAQLTSPEQILKIYNEQAGERKNQ